MSVGSVLKRIREENGLTQEQFADKIGIKRTTYISYENSKTNPEFALIKKIAEIFDVSILDFSDDLEKSHVLLELGAPEVSYNPGSEKKPLVLSSEEKFIIEYFRCLSKEEKADFFEEIKDDYLDRRCGESENNF